ncbi:MAG TPA: hypothetical protein VFC23_19305 [Thermoanaerobaculia bacterium]|nr:hypothetical protein [Thermoanaerobaculia bacterium]
MKRFWWMAFVSISAAVAPMSPAAAKTCALDVVPAATLLLPYFEVDLASPGGETTLVSIDNASDQGVLAHVVLWTDLGVPTLAFDLYLTGYDVQTLNLRDLFAGSLPPTADAARDPADTISPRGELSQERSFAGCAGLLPPPAPPPAIVDALRRAHQGLSSALTGGLCAAQPFRDQVARGYLTVDVIRRCSLLTPADTGYFGPDGVAGHDNVLWGDFIVVHPGSDFAHGDNLVRIESDPALFAGRDTFYGRYVGFAGTDGREPLPTTWATRFLQGGAFAGRTELIVWRDSRQRTAPFPCGHPPLWYPIPWEIARTIAFDEEERATEPNCLFGCPPPLPSPFPAETNRVAVEAGGFPSPFNFGWLYLDLKTTNPLGIADRPLSQSWVGTIHSAQGRFSVGFQADPLDSGCAPRTANPGGLRRRQP